MLVLNEVSLRRSAKLVLECAGVTLQPGGKVGLVGRNGFASGLESRLNRHGHATQSFATVCYLRQLPLGDETLTRSGCSTGRSNCQKPDGRLTFALTGSRRTWRTREATRAKRACARSKAWRGIDLPASRLDHSNP